MIEIFVRITAMTYSYYTLAGKMNALSISGSKHNGADTTAPDVRMFVAVSSCSINGFHMSLFKILFSAAELLKIF